MIEKVFELARKLGDPSLLVAENPLSLGKGHPGVILLFAELDRCYPDEGWDLLAHRHLLAMQEGIERRGLPDLSLFHGLAGMLFAVRAASRGGIRYRRFLQQLEELLLRELRAREGEEFDLIKGDTGIGCYLLTTQQPEALSPILERLVCCSREEMVDCGLAHGLPGPLALFSLASLEGVEVEGQREAIRSLADRMIERRQEDEQGLFWPEKLGKVSRPRAAWCYGNAGISRALFWAGRALGDDALERMSFECLDAAFARGAADLVSPTLCHGWAGLIQAAFRMDRERYREELEGWGDRLLASLSSLEPLGYRDQNQARMGLLDGAAGIALVLLTLFAPLAPESGGASKWDRVLLLS